MRGLGLSFVSAKGSFVSGTGAPCSVPKIISGRLYTESSPALYSLDGIIFNRGRPACFLIVLLATMPLYPCYYVEVH